MTALEALRASGRRAVRELGAATADIPLFWKLILPGVVVVVSAGSLALYVGSRYVADEAARRVDETVSRRVLGVEAALERSRLAASETARTQANLVGVPEAVAAGNADSLQEAAAGLLAVRSEISLVVVAGPDGKGLTEVSRGADEGLTADRGHEWGQSGPAQRVLGGDPVGNADLIVELVDVDHRALLVAAAPVTAGSEVVGVALAGVDAEAFVRSAAAQEGADVALFDAGGRAVVRSGTAPPALPEGLRPDAPVRVRSGSPARATRYDTLSTADGLTLTVAVTIEERSVTGSPRTGAMWMAGLVLVSIVVLLGVSVWVARRVSRRLGRLAETSRALGAGDLAARAPVSGRDEIGELEGRLNAMAEQIEAAHQELQHRVEARTTELRRLYAESTSARQRQTEAFAHVSHELRNPLFAVMSHAELMLDREINPDTPEWVAEYATTIKAAAEELLGHVNNILDATRQEAVPVVGDLEPLSLAGELASLEGTIRALARRGEVEVDVDVPGDLPLVGADRKLLGEIVLNLVSNAVKYTPAGGSVHLTAMARKGSVDLCVADTGVGIPPEAIDHVFEPFYRVEGIRAQGGQHSTGLGLALTKRNVEAHGGEILIESSVGKGTTVTVSLPVAGGRARSRSRNGAARPQGASPRAKTG